MPEQWEPSRKPALVTITPWSSQSLGVPLVMCGQGAPASQNYVTANLAVYIPFWVPVPMTILKMGWGNGSAAAGNLCAGIYKPDGTRLVTTGSTAQSGTATLQVVDVTDTFLMRGLYYLALNSDTSAATQKVIAVLPAAGIAQSLGLLQQAVGAVALPDPATFAKYASAFVPLVMAQGYRTVGP
jgi:hypothetical protein